MPPMRQRQRQPNKRPAPQRARQRQTQRRTDSHAWTMKLGAWAHARMRAAQYDGPTRKILVGATLVSVLAIFVLLAAGLGVLDDMGRGIQNSGAQAARSMGLAVRVVDVQAPVGLAINDYQRVEAKAISGINVDDVMFGIDPQVIQARVAQLPWVEDVMVRRLWPDQIQIIVTPRAASALWQENGALNYMDATGRKLGEAKVASAKGYALIVGRNAGPAAPALFAALTAHKEVADRTASAIWVADRRWTLRLKSGASVFLPEGDVAVSIAQLDALQSSHGLLDRQFARLDLRQPGSLIIRPTAEVQSVNASMSATKSARGV